MKYELKQTSQYSDVRKLSIKKKKKKKPRITCFVTQELLTALTVITSKKPFCVSPSQPFISLVTQQALCLWVVMGRGGGRLVCDARSNSGCGGEY